MRPIGVFDSGVGGLTVVSALRRRLPCEAVLYLGDTARLPYGTKSPETVARYTQRNVDLLVARGVKGVVVACNTASAVALPRLQSPVPVWGVIAPGARRAAARSAGRVGVVGTESTIRSDAYGAALRQLRPGLDVASQACPLFVPLVEEGWLDDPVTERVAERYLAPLVARGIDTLVLGCTHYRLLAPLLARLLGPGVGLVDSGEAVAEQLALDLEAAGLLAPGRRAEDHFLVTDAAERFGRLAAQILGGAVSLELVELI